MNLTQLQNQKESVLATARELASGNGDLAQVKSLMAEAKGIEERIETIKAATMEERRNRSQSFRRHP